MKIGLNKVLKTDYSIDQAILDQSNKIVVLEFILNQYKTQNLTYRNHIYSKKQGKKVIQFYKICVSMVKEFDFIYEIEQCNSFVFFFKNRKIFIDSDSGDNNKFDNSFSNSKKLKQLLQMAFLNCSKGKNYFVMQ